MYGLNNGAQSAFLNTAVADLCAARAMSCLDFPEYPPSDEIPFIEAGAPAISLGHQPRAEAEKLRAFMLNPQTTTKPGMVPEVLQVIHTSNDTASRVEPDTVARLTDFVVGLVMKLDGQIL